MASKRGRRARFCRRNLIRWLYYFESSPVTADETLLHSIPNTQDYYKHEMGVWAVSPMAFKPHPKRDIDGMSFFREDFTIPRKLAKESRHPNGVRVCNLTVVQLRSFQLEAVADPDPNELPGHCIVPKLKYVKKLTPEERQWVKKISADLALRATANGVYSPAGLPSPFPSPNAPHT